MSQSTLKIWLDAVRPKTLPLAFACIVTGSAIAIHSPHFSLTRVILALITALLLQILSNLANDYGDAVKGTDSEERIGPKRAIQQGFISLKSMKKALIFNVILIILIGSVLVFSTFDDLQDILSFLLLGALAILAAIFYTIGKKPYGYQGLGDVSVLIFFGWLGVAGMYYLQTGILNIKIFLPATGCGLLAVCVLNINNLRDFKNDKNSGKNTLVVQIGEKYGRMYYVVLLAAAYSSLCAFTLLQPYHLTDWIFLLTLPFAVKHGVFVYQSKDGTALAPVMPEIVKIALATNLLFSTSVALN